MRSISGIRIGGRAVVVAAATATLCFGVPAAAARWWFGPEPLGLVVAVVVGSALGAAAAWRLRHLLAFDELVGAFRGRRSAAARPQAVEYAEAAMADET